MNNTYFRTGEGNFNNRTSFATDAVLQADHIAQAAERAGKKVVSVEWVASRNLSPQLQGPVVDFRTFFSNRGILLNYDLAGQPAGANAFGVSYQRVDLDRPPGWTNVPASFSPAMQEQLKLTNTAFPATDNVDRFYDLYIYDSTNDSTTNYDSVLVVPSTAGKDGAGGPTLKQGDWKEFKVDADRRARRPDRRLLPEGDRDRARPVEVPHLLHVDRARERDLQRARARPARRRSRRRSRRSSRPRPPADFAPLEAGIVDEDTYVEQGLMWKDATWRTCTTSSTRSASTPTCCCSATRSRTSSATSSWRSTRRPTWTASRTRTSTTSRTTTSRTGARRSARATSESAYAEADETLALGRELMGGEHDGLRRRPTTASRRSGTR